VSIHAGLLLAGVLLLLGIASSKFSARLGMPVLVLFLSVGMLAGSEGLGRIPFEDYALANNIGSLALALILFDGGLRTSLDLVRQVWKPALALSTLGVLFTSLITGLAAAWVLRIPLLQGLLVGSIVGSTAAAAVFSVLRSSGLKLPERLTATLEVESGSNDPMAIFLTLGLIGWLSGCADSAQALLAPFAAAPPIPIPALPLCRPACPGFPCPCQSRAAASLPGAAVAALHQRIGSLPEPRESAGPGSSFCGGVDRQAPAATRRGRRPRDRDQPGRSCRHSPLQTARVSARSARR
jgi:hypothetical protein